MRFFSTEIDGSGWSLVPKPSGVSGGPGTLGRGCQGGLRGAPKGVPGGGSQVAVAREVPKGFQGGPRGSQGSPRGVPGGPRGSQGGPRGVPGGSQKVSGVLEKGKPKNNDRRQNQPPWTGPGRGGPRNLPARAPDPPGGYPPDPRKKH